MSHFLEDLRYSARVLRKAPGATAVAVLALALGIGVNISMFTCVNALVLHPLPFPHLERIMTVWETVYTHRSAVAPANFLDLQRQSRSFDEVAAYENWDVSLTSTRDPERVQAALVSPSFFAVLGSHAALGRTFSKDESQAARSGVVVVSYGFWQHQLAGSRNAIGKSISLAGRGYTVLGVMPDDFDYPLGTDLWAPLSMSIAEQSQRSAHTLSILGLLKPGVAVSQARTEAKTIAKRLADEYPLTNEARDMTVVPLRDLTNGVTARFVLMLLGAAGFVLLLACANVANLHLVRAVSRAKEIAVRAALGASRFQIARQLFSESVLLACMGSIVALLLASWDVAWLKAGIPAQVFRWVAGMRTMRIDFNVVVFTFALCFATAILCCTPAIFQLLHQRSRADLNLALREGGRGTGGVPARSRLQSMLIIAEVALALVLLIGAGFMVKTFQRLLTGYYGYDPKNLLTLQVSLPPTKYSEGAQLVAFYDRVLQEFRTVPGARAVALFIDTAAAEHLYIEGRPEPRPGEPQPEVEVVSPDYLQLMRMPLLKGRFVSESDRPETPRVVVISRSIARHYWPHSDPVGHRIKLGNSQSPALTVVGVCGDVIRDWLTEKPAFTAYVPYTQLPRQAATFSIRTETDPMQLATAARADIRKIDKELPVYDVKTLEQSWFEETSGVRASANTMSLYAVVALLLAATGIFAVISYFVVQRAHDIGVRMALGADAADVLRMTFWRTGRLMIGGFAIGIPAALALSKLMSSLLYNIVRLDWTTFAGCVVMLAAAALLASYIPARRATRIDPVIVLRQE